MNNSLKHTIQLAIVLYGREAVRKEVEEQTKPKNRDKLLEEDYRNLGPFIDQEARNWLDGKRRTSNGEITQRLSVSIQGQSEEAIRRRLFRRLSVRNPERIFRQWLAAYMISEIEYPASVFFKVLKEGQKIPQARELAKNATARFQSDLERMDTAGRSINPSATRLELHEEANRPIVNNLRNGLLTKDFWLSGRDTQTTSSTSDTSTPVRDMSPEVNNKSAE